MNLLRFYLLSGLVLHKAVWELLKRRGTRVASVRRDLPVRLRLIKAAKIGILIGVLVQTILPEMFPIAGEPFFLQLVGVALYTTGLLMAIVARIQLDRNWSDIESAQILAGQSTISHGLYAYIRHPIYVGDLLLLFGLELSLNSWLVLGVVLLAWVVQRQARSEEKKLAATLPGYDVYCMRTKRFIPFVI